jgi:predicted DNA repair protein MutK
VSNTAAKRELPVIWKITKKSLINKLIIIPIAIGITYFAPWIMLPVKIWLFDWQYHPKTQQQLL